MQDGRRPGILGALGGDLVRRMGLTTSWVVLMPTLGAATALFNLAPATDAVVFAAAYSGLAGLVLVWSTDLYPERTSFGVGVSFFTIAAGQAVGAPLTSRLIESLCVSVIFDTWDLLHLGQPRSPRRSDTAPHPPQRHPHRRVAPLAAALTGTPKQFRSPQTGPDPPAGVSLDAAPWRPLGAGLARAAGAWR